jgi:hypothetical protein
MDLKHRIQRSFKPRFAVIYPFGFIFLLLGTLDDKSLKSGIGYIIAGMLIRLWSNGYAIKNNKLTTSGPYAFVCNPLYLGTFLIAIGFVIVLKTSWFGLALILTLIFTYYWTIQKEQGMLLAKFGDAYKDYCQKVPAMIPTLNPYTAGDKRPFSLQRLINSKEHKPVFWVIILLVVFHLKTRILIEHKAMTTKSWTLVALSVVLIGLDIAFELNKQKITKDD